MSDKFRNRYRIASTRLKNWDYGWNATYFVTICTKNRLCFFGDIDKKQEPLMQLTEIGKIAEIEWQKTFELRPDMNLEMGEYVVMPNHFHAIIGIGCNKYNVDSGDIGVRDAMHRVSTGDDETISAVNKFGPQSKNLASIIRGFKSSVTMNARKIDPDFGWQSRFHDHIIRNQHSFVRIQSYIIQNPMKWKNDTFYKK